MKNNIQKQLKNISQYLYTQVKGINDSKFFAGIVILLLNISSKFVQLPLSKTVESYVKYNFSNYILVFAISWMGTRDVFVAIPITIIFALLMEFIFNENSIFCCLNEGFVTKQVDKLNEDKLKKDELDNAIKVVEKAKKLLEENNQL
jgi:hypothetical protein